MIYKKAIFLIIGAIFISIFIIGSIFYYSKISQPQFQKETIPDQEKIQQKENQVSFSKKQVSFSKKIFDNKKLEDLSLTVPGISGFRTPVWNGAYWLFQGQVNIPNSSEKQLLKFDGKKFSNFGDPIEPFENIKISWDGRYWIIIGYNFQATHSPSYKFYQFDIEGRKKELTVSLPTNKWINSIVPSKKGFLLSISPLDLFFYNYKDKSFQNISNYLENYGVTYTTILGANDDYWLIHGLNENTQIDFLFKYDGNNWEKIAKKEGFNTLLARWNGDYWILGNIYGDEKLYKYDGAKFESIPLPINGKNSFNFDWNGKRWLISTIDKDKNLEKFYEYDGKNIEEIIGMNIFGPSNVFTSDIIKKTINYIIGKDEYWLVGTSYGIFYYDGSEFINIFRGQPSKPLEAEIIINGKDILIYNHGLYIKNTWLKLDKLKLDKLSIEIPDNSIITYYPAINSLIYLVKNGKKMKFENEKLVEEMGYSFNDLVVISKEKIDSLPEEEMMQSPSIDIISPNGGEKWEKSSKQIIKWRYKGVFPSFPYKKAEFGLNCNSGKDNNILKNIETFNKDIINIPSSIDWIVPNGIIDTDDCKVLITYRTCQDPEGICGARYGGEKNFSDFSDAPFGIISPKESIPSLILTWPKEGEILDINKTYEITWKNIKVTSPIFIDIYRGNNFLRRLSVTYNSPLGWLPGTWYPFKDWLPDAPYPLFSVPWRLTPGSDYYIKISAVTADGIEIEDFSDAPFSIEEQRE